MANEYWQTANNFLNEYELDSALFYAENAQELYVKLLGENSLKNANCLHTIGIVYYYASMYEEALEYYFKSLDIKLELLGEKHTSVASSYNNIGLVYGYKSEYNKALEYQIKSLEIRLELLGEKHTLVAASYNNIGIVYANKSENDKALEYHFKSLEIKLELLGEKHIDVATSYNNIGAVYSDKSEYDSALDYYQKGVTSCLYNFNDTINVSAVPEIKDYLEWNYLLAALQAKAQIFADTTKDLDIKLPESSKLSGSSRMELALKHYQACDTLITKVRKEITTQSDKIALGEKAIEVYKGAVGVCMSIKNLPDFKNLAGLNQLN